MVELALAFTLLVMLLIGTVSAALAFSRNNTIENAAREGARYGATLDGPVGLSWLQEIRDVTRAAGQGNLESSVPGQYICVAFVDGTGDTRLTDTSGTEAQANTPCFNDGRPAGERRVQVVAERETTIQAAIFSVDVDIDANAAARFERTP